MDEDCFAAAGISPEFHPSSAMQWNEGPNEMSSFLNYPNFDSSSTSFTSAAGDGFFLRHLIGKLGAGAGVSLPLPPSSSIDDANLKVQFPIAAAADHHNLSNPGTLAPVPAISADPGFIERAAKFSCFGSRSFNGRSSNNHPSPPLPAGSKLPRVSSTPALKPDPNTGKVTGSGSNSNDESSVSEQINPSEMSKKRKVAAASKSKSKEEVNPKVENEDDNGSNPKRSKSNNNNNNTELDKKPPEPPKDYIHVRARRGQATDSHSLAERVRREKISERMKLLQDLVPGCNKVTGKALMLDEIINYVQSLQRQVEFLSMKLASVNPALDFNMETLLSKDDVNSTGLTQQMYSTGGGGGQQQQEVQLYQHNVQPDPRGPLIHPPPPPPPHFDAFTDNFPQFPGFNEDDLSSIVQMGFSNFPVTNTTTMKIER